MKHYSDLIKKLADSFQSILSNNFVGFYMHGSWTMSGFDPQKSDLDFIVVIESEISRNTKMDIMNLLIDNSPLAPTKGIEMSLVLREAIQDFNYPTPYSFHFGQEFIEEHKKDPDFICENGVDYDLAAHFTVIYHRGVCILGAPIEKVFEEIPESYYVDSIVRDSKENIMNLEEHIKNDDAISIHYTILNICRVIGYLRSHEILSKIEGAQWGLEHLPSEYELIIKSALDDYTETSQTDYKDSNLLLRFSEYGLKEIGAKGYS